MQGWYKASRVEVDERLGLVVGVDFDVLIWDLLLLEDCPSPLNERTAVGVRSTVSTMGALHLV